ncbi:guanylyl cyclase-related family protein [Salix suchowensis]|nr:guanylyl cyclase-related family protein [Salix suchowensis]
MNPVHHESHRPSTPPSTLKKPFQITNSRKSSFFREVVAVVKGGISDGWILLSSSSSGGKCEDAALPGLHSVEEQLTTDLVQVDVLFADQSMKRKFLLILSGNHIAIALVNQYKCLTVSGKTSCPRHSWLEDAILLGLTSGNSTYPASSHPWSTFRRLGNYCVLSLVLTTERVSPKKIQKLPSEFSLFKLCFGRDYSPKFKKNLGLAACRY